MCLNQLNMAGTIKNLTTYILIELNHQLFQLLDTFKGGLTQTECPLCSFYRLSTADSGIYVKKIGAKH